MKIIEKLEFPREYGLIWEEEKVKEQFEKDARNAFPVLKLIKKREIKGSKLSDPNILIEGDNYHSLSVLNFTHQGMIDVIYIDPPYNTGNKDFKYNDSYVEREDSYRHSKWLSFMDKRLKLAKSLLKESGLIFISIDDNEQAHLKLLCDQIFGEDNFVESLMVEMSNTGGMKVGAAKEGKIAKNGESVLVYAKSSQHKEVERTPLYDFVPGFDSHFNLFKCDDGSISELSKVMAKDSQVLDEFLHFGIKPKKGSISVKYLSEYFDKSDVLQKFVLDNKDKIVRPRSEVPNINTKLRLSKSKWVKYESKKRTEPYYLTLDNKGIIIQLVPVAYNYRNTDDFKPTYGRSVIRGDFWKGFWLDMGNISKEGGVNFDNGKKPVRLIYQLLKWAVYSNKSALVLDFFAGSGTTGHAVLKLNSTDSGNRRFILCTNNENNIAEDVTCKRLKNTFNEYKDNTGLKYFKTAFVKNSLAKDDMKIRLSNECTEMLCLREGIFDGLKSTMDYKIFKQNDRILAIYYSLERDALKELKKELNKLHGTKTLYCFTLDPLGLSKSDFVGWDDISLEPIPQKILDIYKGIYEY